MRETLVFVLNERDDKDGEAKNRDSVLQNQYLLGRCAASLKVDGLDAQ